MLDDLRQVSPTAARAFTKRLPGRRLYGLIERPPTGFQHHLPPLELGRVDWLRVAGQGQVGRPEIGGGVAYLLLDHVQGGWLGWCAELEARLLKHLWIAWPVLIKRLQSSGL